MPMPPKHDAVRLRQRLYASIRGYFAEAGFDEVETPTLVPSPGMEPHLTAFETRFVPEMGKAVERPLFHHTSPEYAMKRLLARGWERIFQLGRCYRNGEIARLHNPEFTMLEFYRAGLKDGVAAGRGYGPILLDLEELTAQACRALNGGVETIRVKGAELDLTPPWDRLTVKEAFATRAGIDLPMDGDAGKLRARVAERGFELPASCTSYEDVFFAVFLGAVEPGLGWPRPTFLVDWPKPMAALARHREDDPDVAERFELYVAGTELANGFFELNDEAEQRRRLVAEQELRRAAGKPVYPLDERFLEAVGKLPAAAGVALGVDRLLMLLGGFETIDDLLLFPASQEWA